ncbi:flagellar motor protein MotA [Stella sp.]|uniref:flagellar motor protein MotA n=1 Tax=Stella sp. TaxID=2912054 RepID=UPI0035AECD96
MTNPRRFLFRMVVFLILVFGALALLYPGLERAFLAKPVLNSLIVAVILFGIAYITRQVLQLEPEAAWADTLRRSEPGLSVMRPPRLLGPVAAVLQERRGRVSLSAPAQRSLLDGLSSRLDETRDISRYLIGLLVFLGLLGTFWGLLETVGAVSRVVANMAVQGVDMGQALNNLQSGLETPLAGMGTAFSSSLFGLGGSLVLGFLDLQAGQAQNRFYNEIEDWLASLTRLSGGTPVSDGDQSVPAYIQALLEQTADNLDNLQRILIRGEESRIQANANLTALTERLGTLTDQMRTEQSLMLRLAESQLALQPVLERLAQPPVRSAGGMDEEAHNQLRAIERQMARLIDTTEQTSAAAAQEVRAEIRLLARTIAALAEEPERRR